MIKKYSITIPINYFDKIVTILQTYSESLNHYLDIEECINIIHFLQKELYYAKQQEKIIYDDSLICQDAVYVFAEWIWSLYEEGQLKNIDNSRELLVKFYQETQGGA